MSDNIHYSVYTFKIERVMETKLKIRLNIILATNGKRFNIPILPNRIFCYARYLSPVCSNYDKLILLTLC
jgi:hypothetical protein